MSIHLKSKCQAKMEKLLLSFCTINHGEVTHAISEELQHNMPTVSHAAN